MRKGWGDGRPVLQGCIKPPIMLNDGADFLGVAIIHIPFPKRQRNWRTPKPSGIARVLMQRGSVLDCASPLALSRIIALDCAASPLIELDAACRSPVPPLSLDERL